MTSASIEAGRKAVSSQSVRCSVVNMMMEVQVAEIELVKNMSDSNCDDTLKQDRALAIYIE